MIVVVATITKPGRDAVRDAALACDPQSACRTRLEVRPAMNRPVTTHLVRDDRTLGVDEALDGNTAARPAELGAAIGGLLCRTSDIKTFTAHLRVTRTRAQSSASLSARPGASTRKPDPGTEHAPVVLSAGMATID